MAAATSSLTFWTKNPSNRKVGWLRAVSSSEGKTYKVGAPCIQMAMDVPEELMKLRVLLRRLSSDQAWAQFFIEERNRNLSHKVHKIQNAGEDLLNDSASFMGTAILIRQHLEESTEVLQAQKRRWQRQLDQLTAAFRS